MNKASLHIKAAQNQDKIYGVSRLKAVVGLNRIDGMCLEFEADPNFDNVNQVNGLFFYGPITDFLANYRRVKEARDSAAVLFPDHLDREAHYSRFNMTDGFANIPIDKMSLSPQQIAASEEILGYSLKMVNQEAMQKQELLKSTQSKHLVAASYNSKFPRKLIELAMDKEHFFEFRTSLKVRELESILSKRVPAYK